MKVVILATVFLGVATSNALAWDWTVKSWLGQSVEISDNRDLNVRPRGWSAAPVSSLSWDIVGRTPTFRFENTGNLSYRTYFGPGAEGTPDGLDKDTRIRLVKIRPLTTYDVAAFYSQRDASTVQLEENSRSNVSGDITTYGVEGGLQHQFSARDKFVFSARAASTTFSSPTQRPYDDFSASGTWTHRTTRTTDLILLVSQYFQQMETSSTEIWRATGGISTRASERLTFSGSAGPVFLNVSGNGMPVADPLSPVPNGGSAVSWVADANLTYRLRPTTRVSLFAGRNVSADSFGDIQLREWVGIYLSEEVNRRSSLTFASTLGRSAGGGNVGGKSDNFDASASYSYRLTSEVLSSLTYRYTQRVDQTGTAKANILLMTVRKEFTVLP